MDHSYNVDVETSNQRHGHRKLKLPWRRRITSKATSDVPRSPDSATDAALEFASSRLQSTRPIGGSNLSSTEVIPENVRLAPRDILWDRAYANLGEKEPSLVGIYESIIKNTADLPETCDHNQRMTHIINVRLKEIEDRRWKLQWRHHSIKIRDQVNKIVKILASLKDLGTSLASLDPIHAGLPWAGICIILPLILNSSKQQENLVDGLEVISETLECYSAIDKIYVSRSVSFLGANLEDSIVKLYFEILKYEVCAACHLNRNTAARDFRNIRNYDDWKAQEAKIVASHAACMTFLGLVDMNLRNENSEELKQRLDGLQALIMSPHVAKNTMITNSDDVDKDFKALYQQIVKWINPPVRQHDYRDILRPQEGFKNSSKWILQHPQIRLWLDGSLGHVWICGRPGCGKSVLSAVIVDELLRESSLASPESAVVGASMHVGSVFCRKNDDNKRTSVGIMKTLVWGLFEQGSSLSLEQKRSIVSRWQAISESREHSKQSSDQMEHWLMEILSLVLLSFRRIYLIIDGLDECERPGQVIHAIQSLYNGASRLSEIHILFVSQKIPTISKELVPGFKIVDLDSPGLRMKSDRDIDIVITGILKNSKDPVIAQHVDSLRENIIERSNGMMLWAILAVKHLVDQVTRLVYPDEAMLLSSIETLAKDMERMFEYLLSHLLSQVQESEAHAYAMKILQWALWSIRPLKIRELALALAISESGSAAEAEFLESDKQLKRLKLQIVDFCYPLVSIQQDDTVVIVHSSLKDFVNQQSSPSRSFQEHDLSLLYEPVASFHMTSLCLEYLNLETFQHYEALAEEDISFLSMHPRYSFYEYAALNWMKHWNRCSSHGKHEPILIDQFRSLVSSKQGLVWLHAYRIGEGRTSGSLIKLQANLNRFIGVSDNRQWLLEMLKDTLAQQENLLGKQHRLTRDTARILGHLFRDSGLLRSAMALFLSASEAAAASSKNSKAFLVATNNLALLHKDEGNYILAEKFLRKILKKNQQNLGPNAADTLESMSNLATVCDQLYQFEEAQSLLERVIKIRNETLGEQHHDTMATLANLAVTLTRRGQLEKAKTIFLELFEANRARYGEEHLTTQRNKHNLGYVYTELGDHAEASRLEEELLQIRTTMFGEKHAGTLSTRHNLAFTYHQQGRLREAAALLEPSIQISRQLLGPAHSSTLRSMESLAAICQQLGESPKWQRLKQAAIEERMKAEGTDEFSYITGIMSKTRLHFDKGDYFGAEKLQLQALNFWASRLGPQHSKTLNSLESLAAICHMRGKVLMAVEIHQRRLALRSSSLVEKHPGTVSDLTTLGFSLELLGRWTEAEQSFRKALTQASEVWGPNDQKLDSAKLNLASSLRKQGHLQEAEAILAPLLEQANARMGELDRHTLYVQQNLSLVYLDQGRLEEAAVALHSVHEKVFSTLGEDNFYTWTVRHSLTRVYRASSQLEKACMTVESVVKWMTNFWGDAHFATLDALHTRGLIRRDMRDVAGADRDFAHVLEGRLHCWGAWHPDTMSVADDLAMLHHAQGRYDEAWMLEDYVLRFRHHVLRSGHPAIYQSEANLREITRSRTPNAAISSKNPRNDVENDLISRIVALSLDGYDDWVLRGTARQFESVLGPNHWESLESRWQMAMFDMQCGNWSNAEPVLEKSWRRYCVIFGPTDKKALEKLFELSKCWKELRLVKSKLTTEAPYVLTWAIRARYSELFGLALQEGMDPNRKSEEGVTPLYYACTLGLEYTAMARRLLDSGAEVNCAKGTRTPLQVAAEKGHGPIVTYLLAAGADVNALDPKGNTALYLASYKGHYKIVVELLGAHTKIDLAAPSTAHPLHIAVAEGHVGIVEMLIEAGADLEAREFELTPVAVAIINRRGQVLERLLYHGAFPNPKIKDEFALHRAARENALEIMEQLLNKDLNIDMPNDHGVTCLHIAAYHGFDTLADFLLERHAYIESPSINGNTALHEASGMGHLRVAQLLVEKGANVHATNCSGLTPLSLAALGGRLHVVRFLVSCQASTNLPSPRRSALELAIMGRHREVIDCLLDHGADVNVQTYKAFSPLLVAASIKDLVVVELLLHHGAKVNISDHQGYTPLHVASMMGDVGTARRLLRVPTVDVNVQSIHGYTALHCAALNGSASLLNLLLSKGANPRLLLLGDTSALALACWNSHADVVSELVRLDIDPLTLDCYGKTSVDWASRVPITFEKMGALSLCYTPTTIETQRAKVRATVISLITNMRIFRVVNDMRYTILGRCLYLLDDQIEAEHAYQLDVSEDTGNDGTLLYNLTCDACSKGNIKGDLYICAECADEDLQIS